MPCRNKRRRAREATGGWLSGVFAVSRLYGALSLTQMLACEPPREPMGEPIQVVGLALPIVGGELSQGFAATGALIMRVAIGSEERRVSCTGTLVGDNQVLTAAHCFANDEFTFNPGRTGDRGEFRMGPDVEQTPIRRRIIRVDLHPLYIPARIERGHDIALAYLDAPVVEVSPAALYLGDAAVLPGKKVVLVGYGRAQGGLRERTPLIRRQVEVAVDSLQADGQYWQYRVDRGLASACQGDSGGPALGLFGGRYHLVGVTSHGDAACASFGALTRVDVQHDWLGQHDLVTANDTPMAACTTDGRCDGGCIRDSDCSSLLCPAGTCTASEDGCAAITATLEGDRCRYLDATGKACGHSELAEVRIDENSFCLFTDRLGTTCGRICAQCTPFGLCECSVAPVRSTQLKSAARVEP